MMAGVGELQRCFMTGDANPSPAKKDASQNHFFVDYALRLDQGLSPEKTAYSICLEQTVEMRDDLLGDELREAVVGKIVTLEPTGRQEFFLRIAYHRAVLGREFPQFLNVLYGNISLMPGIRVLDFHGLDDMFPGPRFGIKGLRDMAGEPFHPLVCTVLKPLGTSSFQLARMARDLARGGVHFIKDDHGLANQDYAPFLDRVAAITEAVDRGNRESGNRCIYFPSFSPPTEHLHERLEAVRKLGVKGLLVAPFLLGLDAFRALRTRVPLVLMAHPSFCGGLFNDPFSGMRPGLVIGKLFRHLGADASIYPNVGGRFLFDLEICRDINRELRSPHDTFPRSFPMPAGGMRLAQVPEMRRLYGNDLVFLFGSGFFSENRDLEKAAATFLEATKMELI